MVEELDRNYHLSYARAFLVGLFEPGLETALQESWRPGASVSRYGRRWHLSKIVTETEDLEVGRIGFVSDDELSTLRFNPDINDFEFGEAPSGVVIPFAIKKSDGVIVYQLRPGVVRETTFTGALQELLNSTSKYYDWSIQSYVEEVDFEDWITVNPNVTRFDISLNRPNPHYHGADWVESAVEGVHAEALRLVAKAPEGETLDASSDLFRDAVDHVRRDYGKAKVVGHDAQGSESTWVKLRGAAARVPSKKVKRGVGPEEVPSSVLMDAINDAPSSLALANLDAQDEDG